MSPASKPSNLLRDVLPDFYRQVSKAMQDEGHPDLAAQMSDLVIDHLCGCGQDGCASLRCEPTPPGGWRDSSVTDIHGDFGEALVDVASDGRIVGFELLGWNELRPTLQAWAAKR